MLTAAICNGKANFISFLTPESDVNVDAPVKFIARNDEIPPIIRNHDTISIILVPKNPKYRSIGATKNPNKSPFNEKRRKGVHGSNIGFSTQPAKYAPSKFVKARPPEFKAESIEYPF